MRLKFIPARYVDVKVPSGNGYYVMRLEHDVYRVEVDGVALTNLVVHPPVTFPRRNGACRGWVATCGLCGLAASYPNGKPWPTRHKAARAALAWVEGPEYEAWSKERELWECERVDYVSCGVSSTGWRRPADGLRHGDEFERM